jgi:hypothetical protein
MPPRTASDLYSEMKNMSVEERIRFFSLAGGNAPRAAGEH